MIMFKVVHANLKQEMHLAAPLILGSYFSESDKCTHVVASGGAMVPVQESAEYVARKVDEYYEWKVKQKITHKLKKTKGSKNE